MAELICVMTKMFVTVGEGLCTPSATVLLKAIMGEVVTVSELVAVSDLEMVVLMDSTVIVVDATDTSNEPDVRREAVGLVIGTKGVVVTGVVKVMKRMEGRKIVVVASPTGIVCVVEVVRIVVVVDGSAELSIIVEMVTLVKANT